MRLLQIVRHTEEEKEMIVFERNTEIYVVDVETFQIQYPLIAIPHSFNFKYDPISVYRHYKDVLYDAFFIASHADTKEKFMIYQSQETELFWARPYDMFMDSVVKNGKTIKRFTKIS